MRACVNSSQRSSPGGIDREVKGNPRTSAGLAFRAVDRRSGVRERGRCGNPARALAGRAASHCTPTPPSCVVPSTSTRHCSWAVDARALATADPVKYDGAPPSENAHDRNASTPACACPGPASTASSVCLAGTGPKPGADIETQTREVLAAIDALLAQAGSDKTGSCGRRSTWADVADFAGMNRVGCPGWSRGRRPRGPTVEARWPTRRGRSRSWSPRCVDRPHPELEAGDPIDAASGSAMPPTYMRAVWNTGCRSWRAAARRGVGSGSPAHWRRCRDAGERAGTAHPLRPRNL